MSVLINLCNRNGDHLAYEYRVLADVVPRIGESVRFQVDHGDGDIVTARVLNVIHAVDFEQRSLSSNSSGVRVYVHLDY